jgi:hypothetical protein
MQLTAFKENLAIKAIRYAHDTTYVNEVTLPSVQASFGDIYAAFQQQMPRNRTNHSVIFLTKSSTNKKNP